MQFLTKSPDIAYLYSLKGMLEANGIPAVIKGENTARMITPFLMNEPSLWVYLDDQAADAEQLILDPDHEVTSGVDVDEFYRITEEVARDPKQFYDMMLNWMLVVGAISIGVIVVIALFGR